MEKVAFKAPIQGGDFYFIAGHLPICQSTLLLSRRFKCLYYGQAVQVLIPAVYSVVFLPLRFPERELKALCSLNKS